MRKMYSEEQIKKIASEVAGGGVKIYQHTLTITSTQLEVDHSYFSGSIYTTSPKPIDNVSKLSGDLKIQCYGLLDTGEYFCNGYGTIYKDGAFQGFFIKLDTYKNTVSYYEPIIQSDIILSDVVNEI